MAMVNLNNSSICWCSSSNYLKLAYAKSTAPLTLLLKRVRAGKWLGTIQIFTRSGWHQLKQIIEVRLRQKCVAPHTLVIFA